MSLELHRVHKRNYPEIAVGDSVRLFKKKDKLDKERVSNWSDKVYKVESITLDKEQPFCKLEGRPSSVLHSELLKV